MAVGNALGGSYTCNIAFIIGICALIKPIEIKDDFFWHKGSHDAGKFIHIFHVFKKMD